MAERTLTASEPVIHEVKTRFVYPFVHEPARTNQVLNALRAQVHGSQRMWEMAEPHELYRSELLTHAADFLFSTAGGQQSCHYFKVPPALASAWFRHGVRMAMPNHRQRAAAPPGHDGMPVEGAALELFLSPHGAGALSIVLRPRVTNRHLTIADVTLFNYRGAQLRKSTMPIFTLPHPADDPERAARLRPDTPAPPAAGARLDQRLGAPGGSFNLLELRDLLLAPLWRGDEPPEVQNQFSVYTVVRLSEATSFDSEDCLHALGPFLAGLAQVEEPHHAGAPAGRLGIANEVLSRKHWAAVSSLGAAHLVADQGAEVPGAPPPAFNEQRLNISLTKYFSAYLLVLLQRLTIHRAIRAARQMTVPPRRVQANEDGPDQLPDALSELRRGIIEFTIGSSLTEVSSREAVNRFYDLSRRGLRISESLALATGAIKELESERAANHERLVADQLRTNIQRVAEVQSKLEWLEVFFVSFYAAELSHIVAEGSAASPSVKSLSIPIWGLVGGGVAAWSLQPWRHAGGDEGPRLGAIWLIVAALAAFAVWVAFMRAG